MVDLTSEMAGLWAALGSAPAHRGRVIQFACANTGEGASTVAREFARLAAVRARKPVWLVDADTLRVRAAMKPIATVPRALRTIDVATGVARVMHLGWF